MASENKKVTTVDDRVHLKDSNVKVTSADNSSESSDITPPRKAGKLDVLIQGVALFSDGYNIQVIGYMNSILAKL